MAFWNIGGFHAVSAVDRVLDKSGHTLRDVLEADDLIQEVLAPNTKLIDYLRQPTIVDGLVDLVTGIPLPTSTGGAKGGSSGKNVADKNRAGSTDGNEPLEAGIDDPQDDTGLGSAIRGEKPGNFSKRGQKKISRKTALSPQDPEKLSDAGATSGSESEGESSSGSDDSSDETSGEELQRLGLGSRDLFEKTHDAEDENDSEDAEDDMDDEEENEDGSRGLSDFQKLATEILSADVWSLMDAIMANKPAMDKLWGLLEHKEDPALRGAALTREKLKLSHFTKVIESLLEKRTDQMLEYISALPNLADLFMNHVDNPPLVDLLLKIISTDHPDNSTGVLDILYKQRLIPKMIARLGPDSPQSEQMAVGDFLKAFVTISGGNKSENCSIGPNELSRQLVSDECISELIGLMLKGGTGMCIAVGVIIEIIRKNNSDYDYVQVLYTTLQSHPPSLRDSIYLGNMLKQFVKAIPDFQKMLESRSLPAMDMPFGSIEPLGFERFRLCELYAELLHCSNMGLLNDPRGERIVNARDRERERVHQLVIESSAASAAGDSADASHQTALDDDTKVAVTEAGSDKMSPDSAEVSAASTTPGPTPMSPLAVESDEDRFEVENEENVIDADIEKGQDESTNGNNSNQMQLDSPGKDGSDALTGDALVAALKEQESSIRADPVVGDQLKIALNDSGCISTVFNLLFQFPWNNFLHNVVFDIVQQVFNGSIQDGFNKFLAINLFAKDKITERIVKGQQHNDEYEQEKGVRLGYVGHLTLISEEVVKFAAVFPPETISPVVAEALSRPNWTQYVGQTLLKLREQYNTILGGRKADEDDGEDDEVDAPGGAGGADRGVDEEQMRDLDLDEDGSDQFSRYMSNQLSGLASGNFGSSDEEDDDEWENVDQSRQRSLEYRELENSDDDEDDDGDDGLNLTRSRSYNH